jgi:plastocyanin
MRSIRLAGLAAIAVAALAAPASPESSSTSTVNVVNFSYSPTPVMIHVNDTVHWVWGANGGTPHSTTSGTCAGVCTADGKWDSGVSATTGNTFDVSAPFTTPGTYHYFCTVHGSAMQGDVIVNNPTSVTFTAFAARRVHRGALITWRTQSEADVLGYVVYRSVSGHRSAVSNLVLARGLTHPASYRFVDRKQLRQRAGYLLQVVHANGARTWFGTATIS